ARTRRRVVRRGRRPESPAQRRGTNARPGGVSVLERTRNAARRPLHRHAERGSAASVRERRVSQHDDRNDGRALRMTAIAWQPYREPMRTTLVRTFAIAVVAATVAARWLGRSHWILLVVVMLWPSFGGHWVELWFLNWLRPRISGARVVQAITRVAVWF